MRRALAAASAALALAAPAAHAQAEPDCTGPAGDPRPGTAAWEQRESANAYCATQRNVDTASNPAYAAALLQARTSALMDPFREPQALAGARFRYERVRFSGAGGAEREGLLFLPCDTTCDRLVPGLARQEPPYPGVVIVHGGAASQEMYLWGAQALAEAGYAVLTFTIGRTENTHLQDARAALERIVAVPGVDASRIGLAGHSAGGVAVSRLGQEDPRVRAIASWDRAQSSTMPADLALRTPALFLTADFNCQSVPVCLPVRYTTPPDPLGPGNKDEDFRRLREAGVETMKVALRAATHLDFTEFPQANGSRHGVVTTLYFTLAWFDRHVRGAPEALSRLTAERFDDSADRHYISGGRFDPLSGRNVPAHIAGQPVRDRLSFHFRSAWFLEGGRLACEDIRAGCPPRVVDARAGACPHRGRFAYRLRAPRGQRVVRAEVRVNGRRRARRRGRALTRIAIAPVPASGRHSVRVTASTNRRWRVLTTRTYRDCRTGRVDRRVLRPRR